MGWGWTEYQKCPSIFFILCGYIDHVYIYLLPLARVVIIHIFFLLFRLSVRGYVRGYVRLYVRFYVRVITNGHKNEKGENNCTIWLKLYTFKVHPKLLIFYWGLSVTTFL